ncbi:Deoxypurine kinase [Staphylococcus aureus]|uniref:Deoxypurine kinase n=1 Tax=Staphylococcus aureus TaxID=1280 RepID=A0A380DKH5_STAAU|nr:Deoxypurine kinase [Staphylococcus aureus]
MHEEEGTMSKEDFKTYSDLFNAMVMTPYFPKPDVMIYLECNYDEVIDRIIERGREMEIILILNIGKSYLNVMTIGLTALMHVQLYVSTLMNMIYTKILIL